MVVLIFQSVVEFFYFKMWKKGKNGTNFLGNQNQGNRNNVLYAVF